MGTCSTRIEEIHVPKGPPVTKADDIKEAEKPRRWCIFDCMNREEKVKKKEEKVMEKAADPQLKVRRLWFPCFET